MPTSTTTLLTQKQHQSTSNGSNNSQGGSMNGANNSSAIVSSEDLQQHFATVVSMSSAASSVLQQSGAVSSCDLSIAINSPISVTSQILSTDDDLTQATQLLNGTMNASSPVINNNLSNNNNNSHTTNNNLLIESNNDLSDELNLKASDLNCINPNLLNGTISSASSMLLSNHVSSGGPSSSSGLPTGFNVDHSPWSTAGDEPSHLSMNGLPGFQNFSPNLFNGCAMAQALQQQQQNQPRRAITASHSGYGPHGLSPNNMGRSTPHLQTGQNQMPPQQQQQQHPQMSQQYKNPYPAWSQAPSSGNNQGPPPQQQQNQQMNQMWNNRGRSAPNLNPMPGMPPANRKPHPLSNYGNASNQMGGGQVGAISPSKYRRSTSYPGKNMQQQQQQQAQGYHGNASNMPDCGGLDGVIDPFMGGYQVSDIQN